MNRHHRICDLDEILVLSILSRYSMTHSDIREELIRLTDGAFPYQVNYVTGLLYRLRSDQFISQFAGSRNRTEYCITDPGRKELETRIAAYSAYDSLLHPFTESKNVLNLSFLSVTDYEKAFNNFTEQSQYKHEDAVGILHTLTRAAFKSGWCAAGGAEPPHTKELTEPPYHI